MKRSVCLGLLVGLSAWGLVQTSALAQGGSVLPNPRLMNSELLARGRIVYQNHCAGCHGATGDGKGPGAYGLSPKPRDFTSATFKFRSTPAGALPTDEDLVRTVRQGLPGTSMGAFDLMAERDVLAVVQYLKTFSTEWLNPEKRQAPIYIPGPPEWFANGGERREHVEKGREMFGAACAACHGDQGDGRGIAGLSLVDNWGFAVIPADLRRTHIRSGRSLSDIYKALTTGINGSPMPSFIDISEEERWQLVAFIDQLRRDKNPKWAAALLAAEEARAEFAGQVKPAQAAPIETSDYE